MMTNFYCLSIFHKRYTVQWIKKKVMSSFLSVKSNVHKSVRALSVDVFHLSGSWHTTIIFLASLWNFKRDVDTECLTIFYFLNWKIMKQIVSQALISQVLMFISVQKKLACFRTTIDIPSIFIPHCFFYMRENEVSYSGELQKMLLAC